MSNYKSYFYKSLGLREDQLPGGKGDETNPTQVEPEQLQMGIKVEMEHTKDPNLAKEIAMDHLTEDPQYYSKLKNAGLADELPQKEGVFGGPKRPMMMQKLFSPTAIMPTPVIAVGVRGTKTGLLPAGGHVEDPEKARLGGWEEMKVQPNGGVKGDPEKARLGGWERVKNIGANSQGAISDTPASDQIKAKGGHFTPDNAEITKGDAPKTNREGSDSIHPMQVQQLGNKPIEDDGTGRDGDKSPPAATAGIEGGSAPQSEAEPHPLSKFVAGGSGDGDAADDSKPGVNRAEKPEEKPESPEQDSEKSPEEDPAPGTETEKEKEFDNPGDQHSKESEPKDKKDKPNTGPWGIEMDKKEEDPEKEEEEDENEEEDEFGEKKKKDIDIDIKENQERNRRFQQLANIKEGTSKSPVEQLRELVGRLNAKGTVTPTLPVAQKFLKELENKK